MAIAFHPNQAITPEELERISREYPHMHFERSSEGALIVAPPVGTLGGWGEGELFRQVDAWARRDGTGRAMIPDAGFTFPDTSILAPDTAWISNVTIGPEMPDFVLDFAAILESMENE